MSRTGRRGRRRHRARSGFGSTSRLPVTRRTSTTRTSGSEAPDDPGSLQAALRPPPASRREQPAANGQAETSGQPGSTTRFASDVVERLFSWRVAVDEVPIGYAGSMLAHEGYVVRADVNDPKRAVIQRRSGARIAVIAPPPGWHCDSMVPAGDYIVAVFMPDELRPSSLPIVRRYSFARGRAGRRGRSGAAGSGRPAGVAGSRLDCGIHSEGARRQLRCRG